MRTSRLPLVRRLAAAVVATVAGSVVLVGTSPPAGSLPSTLHIEGRGWGHGRGMGQYGALGYAIDHGRTYLQILGHFYANTTPGLIGNDPITVRLMEHDGQDLRVRATNAFSVVQGTIPVPAGGAARFQRIGVNRFRVYTAPAGGGSCNGPWTSRGDFTGPIGARQPGYPAGPGNDRNRMLQVCRAGDSVRWYRGTIHAYEGDGTIRAVNRLNMEEYLRGVVPRESPAYWGGLGGGRGMEALKAQAVAARSYARSENRYSYAKTCDTISCQVYGGAFLREGSTVIPLEHANTDSAVALTAGQVRLLNGAPARTEFSSSTGGHTAGGTFPAVVDDGDDISSNPNHTWSTTVARSTIERRFPSIGTLISVDTPARNGLGALGGRVLKVTLRGSRGSVSMSGNDFRREFGLKSDWFRVLNTFSVHPAVGLTGNFGGDGYWITDRAGGVFSFGGAPFHGSMGGKRLNAPMVDMTAPNRGNGYWLVAGDGGVFSFNLRFFGSTGSLRLNKPVVGMAAHPTGNGYWFAATDGGVFSYAASRFKGSMGGRHLNRPVVGMASTPSGNGYWLVATDGGIFSFGDARFHGSTGSIRLNQPIVAMAATPSGKGYWLVARDGGIFAFGDAKFHGSTGGTGVPSPIVDMARTRDGLGYWFVAADGTAYGFGTAQP